MPLWNLGSINADLVFSVPHVPGPGETLSSTGRAVFLGGKGANMSVAAARAGCHVHHIGAVGADGRWAVERLRDYGVETGHIAEVGIETAQAIIAVGDDGENSIILHAGANAAVPLELVEGALSRAGPGDWFVAQNETVLQRESLSRAKAKGLSVAYAAAPFSAEAVRDVLPYVDLLILNAVEAEQLHVALGRGPSDLGVRDVVVTLGKDGAEWHGAGGVLHIPALEVTPIDTTGAGDTFTGYLLAELEAGRPMADALALATRAAAVMVTRLGTADVIPTRAEVLAFGD